MKVTEILKEGKDFVQTTSTLTSDALVKKLNALLTKLEKEGEKITTATVNRPAAPDTSKFSTPAMGFVKLENNVVIHGAYNSSVTYNKFLKIGSAIHTGDKQALVNKFFKELKKWAEDTATENTHIKCADGVDVSIRYSYGSSWGGIGYRVAK
jgi:hypothetical protein